MEPYYTAKPVRHERDANGNNIIQVNDPNKAEFWSVYKYEWDKDGGVFLPVCIADFFGEDEGKKDAEAFVELKNKQLE